MGSCQCSSGEGQEYEEGRSCRHVQAAGNPINVANALRVALVAKCEAIKNLFNTVTSN